MAKSPARRFPECEKWQNLQRDDFRWLGNGKISSETVSRVREMAKSPDDGSLLFAGDQKIHLLTHRYAERVRKMTTARSIICRKAIFQSPGF